MLTYTFSRREKVLIALFSILLSVVGWYKLVYVTTTDQILSIESQIQEVDQKISASEIQLAKKREMEQVIEMRIAQNAKPTPIPNFDNIKPLMAELDSIMTMTDNYALTFQEIDTESGEYILRGVDMHFECDSYELAEKMITSVAEGPFPCIIDSINISSDITPDSLKGLHSDVKTSIHVVFYERP